MTLEFFIDGKIPVGTHQMKRVCVVGGKPRFYEPAILKAAREYYMARLKEYAPKEPFEGAVILKTYWYYKRNKDGLFLKTTPPDLDNLVKLIKNCLTACGFLYNNTQIAYECSAKLWSDDLEGVSIWIENGIGNVPITTL